MNAHRLLHQRRVAMKSEESEDRILIQTWPKKVWATEKMKCKSCKICWRMPGSRQCIYGGPFVFVRSPFEHSIHKDDSDAGS